MPGVEREEGGVGSPPEGIRYIIGATREAIKVKAGEGGGRDTL